MSKILSKYINGNTLVVLYEDGTKTYYTEDDEFDFEFPNSMDISITTVCQNNCKYCYMRCNNEGVHADLINSPLFKNIPQDIEIAINLNNCDHPQLLEFLYMMKDKNVYVNGSVNQLDFIKHEDYLADLIKRKLIYGLGISLNSATKNFIERIQQYPNAVIHTINGITTPHDYVKLVDKNLKVLILGYKDKGRGHDYLVANEEKVRYNQKWLHENVSLMMKHNWYNVLSFDNLALEQLKIKEQISPEDFDKFYQGEEGTCSMYVDLVSKTFGVSSLVPKKEMLPLKDDVVEMFKVVKSIARGNYGT